MSLSCAFLYICLIFNCYLGPSKYSLGHRTSTTILFEKFDQGWNAGVKCLVKLYLIHSIHRNFSYDPLDWYLNCYISLCFCQTLFHPDYFHQKIQGKDRFLPLPSFIWPQRYYWQWYLPFSYSIIVTTVFKFLNWTSF